MLKNVQLGEWDLLDIADGVTLDGCTVRPMAGERNTSMLLRRIVIGRNASVGVSSVIAPGTTVPEETCIGPNSSSWEMDRDATEANRDTSATKAPEAHWALRLFVTAPLWAAARLLYLTPWVLGLLGMVYGKAPEPGSSIASTLNWFAGGERIGYHYLARALRTFFGPLIVFAFVGLVRKVLDLLFGPLIPGSTTTHGQVARCRMQLMRTLMPTPQFHDFTELFGSHYETTSMAVRMMGGRAGKRIYWPGTGPTIGDYHLIDIGNDVVFGSRSHLITTDGTSSARIRVGDGAMIADRTVVMPGVVVEDSAILGSGAMTRRGNTYNSGGTYVGSRGGDAICLSRGVPGGAAGLRRRRRGLSRHEQARADQGPSITASDSEVSLGFDSNGSTLAKNSPDAVTVKSVSPTASSFAASASQTPRDDGVFCLDIEKQTTTIRTFSQPVSHGALSRRLQKETKSSPLSSNQSTLTIIGEPDDNASIEKLEAQTPPPPEQAQARSPFGRAFHEGQAPYYVLGQWAIFCYSSFIVVFVHLYWDVASLSAVQIANFMYRHIDKFSSHGNGGGKIWRSHSEPFIIFGLFSAFICVLATAEAVVALALVIASKWALLGSRQPGNHDWDKSSYCQRWQVLLAIEKIRLRCFGGNGILGLLTGTAYCSWYFRALGARVGRDCALFSNGTLSLVFTEPDLLTLGDRVVVDDASLVGHINSRGKFDLNRLSVGDRCVLRTNSRLLSGAHMGSDSCLLEHTLIMGGDVVEQGRTMQGWPAERYTGCRV